MQRNRQRHGADCGQGFPAACQRRPQQAERRRDREDAAHPAFVCGIGEAARQAGARGDGQQGQGSARQRAGKHKAQAEADEPRPRRHPDAAERKKGDKVYTQPGDCKRAAVRIVQNFPHSLGRGMACQRIGGIAVAVEVNAAAYQRRQDAEDRPAQQRRQREKCAQGRPGPAGKSEQHPDQRKGRQGIAHIPARPFKLRHRQRRIQAERHRRRLQNPHQAGSSPL